MKKTVLSFVMVLAVLGANAMDRIEFETTTIKSEYVVAKVSPFCMAIVKGDLEMVEKMIELGEDVNQWSNEMTPVMFAARYNKVAILKVLLKNGANLRAKTKKGYTAKKFAKLSNAVEALALVKKELGK